MAPPSSSTASDPSAHEIPCDRYIVGIGASAGGLEPLEAFFQVVPEETDLSFVVVQHLSPDYESQMDEILARVTKLPIQKVQDGMEVEDGHIYLIPPAKTMIISQGKLLLTDKETDGVTFPIDTFFRSLAQDAQRSAIGVILSGTGSDGSRGVVDIHEAGGLVLAQDEVSAKFPQMPISAEDTGVVDLVMCPEQMPAAIQKFADKNLTPESLLDNLPPLIPASALDLIFKALHDKCGIDFSQYKPNTISRRIERRMQLSNISGLEEYASYLNENSSEVDSLYRDLLIGVTSFFRNEEAFEVLTKKAIRPLVEKATEELRIWIPGCASGEEPYSIAIILSREFEKAGKSPLFKIFASDVHSDSIRTASAGRYEERALENLDEETRSKFFGKEGDSYVVNPELRSHIVFTEHNLMTGVPFTRLDLISCRNLLIYFQNNAQKKALSLFHFSLKLKGFLFLGQSESLGELDGEFTVLNAKWNLFQKRRDSRLLKDYGNNLTNLSSITKSTSPYLESRRSPVSKRSRFQTRTPWERTLSESDLLRAYDNVLSDFMPEGFLVDDRFRLIHTFAGGERFLHIRGGRTSQSITDLIHDSLRTPVSGALQQCAKSHKKVTYGGIAVVIGDSPSLINLEVRPYRDSQSGLDAYIVTLTAKNPPSDQEPTEGDIEEADQKVVSFSKTLQQDLEAELRFTKENLQATVEEFETSNEELQATNEELVASNEELQSSNEELHSVNEELDTVNAEYQKKIDELSELTADTNNLLAVTNIGVVFLDRDYCIRKVTPHLSDIFRIIDHDLGRDIREFPHLLTYDGLADDLRKVAEQKQPVETEITLEEGRKFMLRMSLYRTDKANDGFILSVVEITSIREAEERLEDLSNLVESSNDAIIGYSPTGKITAWNPGADDLYGYSKEEAVGKNAVDFIVPQREASSFLEMLDQVIQGHQTSAIVCERLTNTGETVTVSQRLSTAARTSSNQTVVASIDRDITKEIRVRRDRDRLASVLEEASDFVGMCTKDGTVTYINRAGLRICGFSADHNPRGMKITQFHPSKYRSTILEEAMPAAKKTGSWRGEVHLTDQEGKTIPAQQLILFHEGKDGGDEFYSTIIRDLTSERAAFKKIRKAEKAASDIADTLSEVVDQFPEILIVVDAQSKVSFTSPQAKLFLDHHQGAGLPLDLDEVVAKSIREDAPYLPDDFEGVKAFEIEGRPTRYYLSRVNVLHNDEGEVSGAVITVQDVTEFRLMDDLKSSLIGTVSHELKNPVAGILMGMSLLREKSLGDLNSDQEDIVNSAFKECERISETIASLLDLTRFDESARKEGTKVVKIQTLVSKAISNCHLIAEKKGITVQTRTDSTCDAVKGDRDRITMVLDNLLSNAIKHSPVGSTVRLETDMIDDEMVEFQVIDSGPGIAPEHQSQIFGKFFKVPGNEKAGSGLGLNIAKQFVEAHGGKIGVRDHDGEGCTFFVRLPAAHQ